MRTTTLLNTKRFQKKNLNKFFKLKKKTTKDLLVKRAGLLKQNQLNSLDSLLRRKTRNFRWVIKLVKNRTKKPLSSKLGGGKGKIDYTFSNLKKYSKILVFRSNVNSKHSLKALNLVSKFKFKYVG